MKYLLFISILFLCSCEDDSLNDDNDNQDFDFIEVEEYFSYNQSDLLAFYFFEGVLINNQPIDTEDWVAAFNGDVCVGAKKWDCTSSSCELPVYGYNSINPLTNGYMLVGEFPSFKI